MSHPREADDTPENAALEDELANVLWSSDIRDQDDQNK